MSVREKFPRPYKECFFHLSNQYGVSPSKFLEVLGYCNFSFGSSLISTYHLVFEFANMSIRNEHSSKPSVLYDIPIIVNGGVFCED